MPTVRCLSFHATYRCQDSGACCTSGWPIEIESDRLGDITRAIEDGRIADTGLEAWPSARARASGLEAWRLEGLEQEHPALVPLRKDTCAFYDASRPHHCSIQHALGHGALPLACRQFPRVVVIDPRGISVTLSHYCPTAAAMLDTSGPVTIVENGPAFPDDGEYEGLDARESLPPLLRPGLLMDWESWWEFERRAVELLGNADGPAADALAMLRDVVEHVRPWKPGDGALSDRIDDAFGRAVICKPLRASAELEPDQRSVRPTCERSVRPASENTLRRFLAAHAFANWTAHFGQGLRTWLRSLEAAHELATTQGVREADLQLRHYGNPKALAETWSAVE